MTTHVSAYPSDPYPGLRPDHSYIQSDDRVLRLNTAGSPDMWSVADTALDGWLRGRAAVVMAERVPLLSYGSNACPSKHVDLRRRFSMPGPVVMTRCSVAGLAAAWCNGERGCGSIPATLAVSPGSEKHFLWWVAPDQWSALDRCEGIGGNWYGLFELSDGPGTVLDENDAPVENVLGYVGGRPDRYPLVDEAGRPMLVRDHGQDAAAATHERLRWLQQPTPASVGRAVAGHPLPSQSRSGVAR